MARRPFSHNLLASYASYGAGILVPLLLLPFLARTLGPDAWGRVGFVNAGCLLAAIVLEFGFDLSATRRVSHAAGDGELRETVGSVLAAKGLLAVAAAGLLVAGALLVPGLREDPLLLAGGALWAFSLAMSPLWFFNGRHHLATWAPIDMASRAVGAGAVLLLVDGPGDAWMVPGLQGAAMLAGVAAGHALMLRGTGRVPLHGALRRVADGKALFAFKAFVALYTVFNGFLLGLLTGPVTVAIYLAAEGIVRAAQGTLGPLGQVLFPHVVSMTAADPRAARRFVATMFWRMLGLGAVVSLALLVLAGPIVRVFLGPEFTASIPVLRILAGLPVLVAASNILGIQSMLPNRFDRAFLATVLLGAVACVGLALLLVPGSREQGMAWAVLAGEGAVTATMAIFLHAKGHGPFRRLDAAPPSGASAA